MKTIEMRGSGSVSGALCPFHSHIQDPTQTLTLSVVTVLPLLATCAASRKQEAPIRKLGAAKEMAVLTAHGLEEIIYAARSCKQGSVILT